MIAAWYCIFCVLSVLKDYTDITANFSQVFTAVSGNIFTDNDNVVRKNVGTIKVDDKVDFDLLISSIPKNLVNDKCFNEETRNLINALALSYFNYKNSIKDGKLDIIINLLKYIANNKTPLWEISL